MLRLSARRISKKARWDILSFSAHARPVQLEMSWTPPQRFGQGVASTSTFVCVWRITRLILRFVLRDKPSDWHGCCFLVRTLDSSVQPAAHKHLQKRGESRSNPRAWLTATCLGGQFSTGSDLQCFTSLQVSLVPWHPRVDLFYFTCTDTLCRFKPAMKHLNSYLMRNPGTRVYLISLRWNTVVRVLGPWTLSLVINGCRPRTTIYHYRPELF